MSDYNRQESDHGHVGAGIGSTGSDGLAASARALASHAEELMQSTAASSSESIIALREKLASSLQAARHQLNSAQDYAVDRSKQAADATDSYVHQKPWQAIGIAALAGVVIGFMSRSGSHGNGSRYNGRG